jgi:heavy metal efflux system protein
MLNKLIQFALEQRLFVLLLTIILAGAGVLAFQQLPIDAFPDVSSPQVKIIIKAAGMTPEEIESRITAPVEVEMLGIPRQVMLRAIAKYGLTDITVDFEEGTDVYWARQQVTERLNSIWNELPPDISGGLAPLTTPLGEMFMFTINGDLSLEEKRELLDWVIRPALRTVSGVADVNALGGFVRAFEVIPDNTQMASRGVTLNALQTALQRNNKNDGAGRLQEGEESLLVRAEGSIRKLEDVQTIVIQLNNSVPVRVGDVAQVRLGSITRYGAVTQNGKSEAVEGLVLGLRGANAREVVAGVSAKLAELAPTLPKGVTTQVFYNRGDLVERAVYTVAKALVEAIVLVIVLLVLFLGDGRAALTVALILPLAALTTFILMRYFGLSANLMSLGGLAIAIGMLVDAAVVVVENIVDQLAHQNHPHQTKLQIIYQSVSEVSTPVTTGIIIIILVFLPLLTLQGLEGKLFIPVALTIVFALAGSLLLSLTVIPVLSSFVLGNVKHHEPFLMRLFHKGYTRLLHWALQSSKTVVILAGIALVSAMGLFPFIGKTFMPTLDEGNLIVQVEKVPSINLESSLNLDLKVQQTLLKEIPEIEGIVARSGSDELGLDPMGVNQTDTFLVLKPRDQWQVPDKEALQDKLRKALEQFAGLNVGFTQPIEMRVSEMLTGTRGDVAIKIFGRDLEKLNEKALKIVELLKGIQGSEDVLYAANAGVQYFSVQLDRQNIGRLGLNVDDIEDLLRMQLEGKKVGMIYETGRRIPLIMKGSSTLRNDVSSFESLLLTLSNGQLIPLTNLAKLERTEGPVQINRERAARLAVITVNVRDRDLVGYVDEAKRIVAAKIPLETGYSVQWGGQFENQQRAAARLTLVIPISILLIFILLFSSFQSVRHALLVLLNIPFALIGGIMALWLAKEYLSVPASVGFIALLGIAVLNGVMLVSYFNQLRANGKELTEVVVEGAQRRLRPVLMTAGITAFGLVPLLFATGPGAEIQKPLAIVVIGGLATSTLLTLILLPILYRRFG